MNHFIVVLVVLVVLVGAIACYLIGFGLGIALFVVLGVAFEIALWVLAFRAMRSDRR